MKTKELLNRACINCGHKYGDHSVDKARCPNNKTEKARFSNITVFKPMESKGETT